jgi:hypothetical protein
MVDWRDQEATNVTFFGAGARIARVTDPRR